MSGCCLYCEYAAAYAVMKDGEKRKPPRAWYRLMNIYCNHPEKGGGGQCLPISWSRCTSFKSAETPQIQRRIDFYKQYGTYRSHAQIIANRRL